MGVTDAFDARTANFPNISDANLHIGIINQNTYLTIDEQGCEAAAVTSELLVGATLKRDDPQFKANRPFIFIIREVSSGAAILFIGQKG